MLYNPKTVNPKIVTKLIFLLEPDPVPDTDSERAGPGTNPLFVIKFK